LKKEKRRAKKTSQINIVSKDKDEVERDIVVDEESS
jgi:hypothetical protein